METYFAPAEKTDRRIFASQIESISNSPIMSKLLEATCGLLIVLNENRQIVGLNETFLHTLGISDASAVLGLRLGETLQCIHASELPSGCGTTPHCTTCGAAIAMMSAINENKPSEQTCALTADRNGEKRDKYLSIQARPLEVDGRRWILIFAQDITHQHSLASLENIFFHDFNNILTVLAGNSELLAMRMPDDDLVLRIMNASKRLCSEVSLQRFLSKQKDDANFLSMKDVYITDIKNEVELIICNHLASNNRKLEQNWPNENIKLQTDIHLISRVLGNMLLNALESTAEGGTVRLNTTVGDKDIVWDVWNDAYIPAEVQLRIFQKHFSTKGLMGRGLGTHSMKLLGEKYLNGQVSFRSSSEDGTIFSFKHPIVIP